MLVRRRPGSTFEWPGVRVRVRVRVGVSLGLGLEYKLGLGQVLGLEAV